MKEEAVSSELSLQVTLPNYLPGTLSHETPICDKDTRETFADLYHVTCALDYDVWLAPEGNGKSHSSGRHLTRNALHKESTRKESKSCGATKTDIGYGSGLISDPLRCRYAVPQHSRFSNVLNLRTQDRHRPNHNYAKQRKKSVYIVTLLCLIFLTDPTWTTKAAANSNLSNTASNATSHKTAHIRTPRLAPEVSEGSVIIQTKYGQYYKGILLSDWVSSVRTSANRPPDVGPTNGFDSNVVGFLGIRYASAPIKRLRFMPPTAYSYAPNQVHEVKKFGPICMQRWPVDLSHLIHQTQFSNLPKAVNQFSHNNFHQEAILPQNGTTEALPRNHQASFSLTDDNLLGKFVSDSNASIWDMQMSLTQRLMSKEAFKKLKPLFKRLAVSEQSEDCLNLNIYIPLKALPTRPVSSSDGRGDSNSNQLLPVLVIIHGESFDYGAGSTINGFKFVQQNRLLAITFNYRLNILGFPPRLLGASRGNLGLMDQVAALHWIKDNIEAFGGAPNNITLMGVNRGAIFVNLLMLSPLAKGLFERAIMEDGSALTPLVANHIISPLQSPSAANTLGVPNEQSVEHVRLLARLCDCPIYVGAHRTPANSSSQQQQQQLRGQQHQQPPTPLVLAEEARANALTFECLRHRPVEQLLQRVPLELLHLNANSAQLSISSRWLRHYAPIVSIGSSAPTTTTTTTGAESESQWQTTDAHQMARLAALAIKDQLEHGHHDQDLFGAIYGQPIATGSVRPLFGPIVDGTIVPEEDLAQAMLKSGSPFGQRSLLIGWSYPIVSSATTSGRNLGPLEGFEMRHSHPMADRITGHMEQVGLSDEQALNFVASFVRSFYRYHNQEITNTIINHYLTANSAKRKSRAQQKQPNSIVDDELDSEKQRQQLFVLHSLMEAFEDALTNVPMLKIALIHATRQLESLVGPFLGQLLDKQLQASSMTSNGQIEDRMLMENFVAFARTLFNDPNWPLELRPSLSTATHRIANYTLQQPKATYLYQLDSGLMVDTLRNSVQLLAHDNGVSGAIGKQFRDTLSQLMSILQSSEFRSRLSIGCSLDYEWDFAGGEIEDDADYEKRVISLESQLIHWICSRFSSVVANFVANGNVNHLASSRQYNPNEPMEPISKQLSQLETDCFNNSRQQYNFGDHYMVSAATNKNEEAQLNDGMLKSRVSFSCEKQLNNIAINYLFRERENGNDEPLEERKNWNVFNIFDQRMASMPLSDSSLWRLISINDALSLQYDSQKSTFAARSAFWSSFLPALNCTRTQPIIPTSLLAGASQNSTLLNLNLIFTCQLGARTAQGVIETIVAGIKQQLVAYMHQQHQSSMDRPTSSIQNHHSLRMANMSQTSASDDNTMEQSAVNEPVFNVTNLDFIQANGFAQSTNNNTASILARAFKARYSTTMLMGFLILVSLIVALAFYAIIRFGPMLKKGGRKTQKDNQVHNQSSERKQSITRANSTNSSSINEDRSLPIEMINCATIRKQSAVETVSTIDQLEPADELNLAKVSQTVNGHNCRRDQNQSPYLNGVNLLNANINNSALCRSHSSLATSTTTASSAHNCTDNANDNQTDDSIKTAYYTNQFPILASTTNHYTDSLPTRHRQDFKYQPTGTLVHNPKCILTNGNDAHYNGGSSSETPTQAQCSSVASITKKRVKIKDPIGTMRRKQAANRQQVLNGSQEDDGRNWCPVHRSNSSSFIAQMEVQPNGFFLDESGLLSANIWQPQIIKLNDDNDQSIDFIQDHHHHHHNIIGSLPHNATAQYANQYYQNSLQDSNNGSNYSQQTVTNTGDNNYVNQMAERTQYNSTVQANSYYDNNRPF